MALQQFLFEPGKGPVIWQVTDRAALHHGQVRSRQESLEREQSIGTLHGLWMFCGKNLANIE